MQWLCRTAQGGAVRSGKPIRAKHRHSNEENMTYQFRATSPKVSTQTASRHESSSSRTASRKKENLLIESRKFPTTRRGCRNSRRSLNATKERAPSPTRLKSARESGSASRGNLAPTATIGLPALL